MVRVGATRQAPTDALRKVHANVSNGKKMCGFSAMIATTKALNGKVSKAKTMNKIPASQKKRNSSSMNMEQKKCLEDVEDEFSNGSEMSLMSRGSGQSSGLDCLCNAVEIELSGAKGDSDLIDDNSPDNATTQHKVTISESDKTNMSNKENRAESEERSALSRRKKSSNTDEVVTSPRAPAYRRFQENSSKTTLQKKSRALAAGQNKSPLGMRKNGSSAFEAVLPKYSATASHPITTVPDTDKTRNTAVEAGNSSVDRQKMIWQIRQQQLLVASLEQKYGKTFPEVGRIFLSLARLFSTIDMSKEACFCLSRSWEAFRANFSVSRSPLSCIGAYRAIFKNIKGFIDDEVEKEMEYMERTVDAMRKAAAAVPKLPHHLKSNLMHFSPAANRRQQLAVPQAPQAIHVSASRPVFAAS